MHVTHQNTVGKYDFSKHALERIKGMYFSVYELAIAFTAFVMAVPFGDVRADEEITCGR